MIQAGCEPLGELAYMDHKWSGDRLREVRKAFGMTQAELGKAVGKAQAMISQWEIGDLTPDVDDFKDLCDALEVWCDTFYRGVGTPIRWRKVPKSGD